MGFRVGEKCFDTNANAADAFFTAQPTSFFSGATTYVTWFEKNAANVWQVKRQSIDGNGVVAAYTSTAATVPTFPACDQIGITSDLAAAWSAGFILPMAGFSLAYLVGRLVAMFNPDHG